MLCPPAPLSFFLLSCIKFLYFCVLDYVSEQRTTSPQPSSTTNVSHPLPAPLSLPISCDYVLEFSLGLSLVFTTLFSILTSLLSLTLYLSRRSLLKKLGGNDDASHSFSIPFSTLCSALLNVFTLPNIAPLIHVLLLPLLAVPMLHPFKPLLIFHIYM
jgi:hypothetical protein